MVSFEIEAAWIAVILSKDLMFSVFWSCFTFRLEKEKSQAHVQAQTEAQAQVKDEVSRILALEKEQSIQKAIPRERITAEDERLQAQIYVSKFPNTELHESGCVVNS